MCVCVCVHVLNATVEAKLEAKRIDEAKLRGDMMELESKHLEAVKAQKEAEESRDMMNPLIIENRQLNTGYNLLEEMYQARFEGRLVPVMQGNRLAKQQPRHYLKELGLVQQADAIELGLPEDDMAWTTWNAFGDVVPANVIRSQGEAVGFKEAFVAELRAKYGHKKADKIVKLLLKTFKDYTGCRRSNTYSMCTAFWHKSADRELNAEEKAEFFGELMHELVFPPS